MWNNFQNVLFKKFLAQLGDQRDIFWKFYLTADTLWSPKTRPNFIARLSTLMDWLWESWISFCDQSSQRERYFSWFYCKSHYYRLNSHCFQLWKRVYSEVSSKKTTMYQKYALLHDIKLCTLKMSVTYIMSSAQISFCTPCQLLIRYNRGRDQWDLYYIYIHMTSPNFPSFQ